MFYIETQGIQYILENKEVELARNLVCITLLLFLTPTVEATNLKEEVKERPNIILITLDTVRADHLPCYGYGLSTTPHICSMAQGGIRYECAFTPIPLTLPAHASILTGQGPEIHGILDNAFFRLEEKIPTITQVLKAEGYHTRAYIASAVLDRVYGLAHGFDQYDDNVRVGRPEAFGYHERAASQVVDAVERDQPRTWLHPFFLWVHFYDAHDPYVPPSPFDTLFKNPYDGELAFVDSQFQRLMDLLKDSEAWRPDKDWVFIVGDHGEDLGDYGEMRHGLLLTPATLQVPLILRPPGPLSSEKIKVVHQPVTIIGVSREIASLLLGKSSPIPSQGRLSDDASPAPVVLATYMPFTMFRWSPMVGLFDWPYLFIRGKRIEVYNLREDPRARKNLAREEKEKVRTLSSRLEKLWPGSSFLPKGNSPSPELDERLDAVRSLGYAGSWPADVPKDLFTLPHPGDRVWIYRKFLQAKTLMSQKDWARAKQELLILLKADPSNTLVLSNLATVYEAMGELDRALMSLNKVTQLLPRADYPWVHKGEFDLRRGRLEEARKSFAEALQRNPRNASAYLDLFELEITRGNMKGAAKVLEKAAQEGVADPEIALYRSIFLRSEGKLDEAARSIRESLAANPDDPRSWIEVLRVYCDPRWNKEEGCEHLIPNAMTHASGLSDAWVTVARWYEQKGWHDQALFCWIRALETEGLRPEHRTLAQEKIQNLRNFGVKPTAPKWWIKIQP